MLALGLMGAGSRNTRVGKLLTDLIAYYEHGKRDGCLFVAKIVQALLHLGKGALTLSIQLEAGLLRHCSVAVILVMMLQFLQTPPPLHEQHHFLFLLSAAM